ncbi:MAG: 50S ribosomal protein L6 [Flavobacteriales bacterium]|nr:50S ribosomal protein L6 [Flavobacteriales bacterium]MCB9203908.1 50S ribosomal protein L6 [Flavobacteriales bacterium]
MSRVGLAPVEVPQGVEVTIGDNNLVTVKGPLGELTQEIKGEIAVEMKDGSLELSRANDQKQTRAYHGLYRSLINNMVEGVSKGYEKKLELVGVGYRAEAKGQQLELSLGFSHNVVFLLPGEIKVETLTERGKNPIVTLKSHDKQLIGQVCAKIRSLRKPEPYKGKGIRFVGEQIRRKAGKSASK